MLKKKSFLDKIVKKDYNNELEKLLEEKKFGESVKSALLSILYKIEVAYRDLEIVKKDVESKDEYVSCIFDIIKEDCNSIKIVKMSDEGSEIPVNKTYIIDKVKKEILSYPIERKLLYAIVKMGKKDKIIKDDYFVINETLSELLNVGNNINMVEPLRDFNGYSWSVIPQEFESVEHNLVYQNLRMIIGYKFLNRWIANNEFMIDYFEEFKEELENRYGKERKDKVVDLISEISILLNIKFNDAKNEELECIKDDIKKELEKVEEKESFIQEITQRKVEIAENIKEIDTVINNRELLQEEYTKRNEVLPLDKKIFSMRVLSKMMEQEREKCLKYLERLNEMLNPQNFVKYKKELEDKYKYLKILDKKDKDKELDRLKIELQKVFLEIIEINVNKAETKEEIEKIIYDFRYYLLLPYSYECKIQDIENLQVQINEISKLIINKAIDLNVIERISSDEKTNYEILKNMFYIRIIRLEDAYLKITEEKDKFFVQIFDENIFEEKIEICKPEGLEMKLNKKVPIMSH